ncbi:MAG TPA: hypothetical protein VNS63_15510, partial [Blastocatellia bacterium]|nr:hypothetical protein [Blastocatellia bacterium]
MVFNTKSNSRSARRGRRATGVSLICLLVAAAAGSACKSGYPVAAKNAPGEPKEARQVKVARVTEVPMERAVTVTGTLAAYDQATVSA